MGDVRRTKLAVGAYGSVTFGSQLVVLLRAVRPLQWTKNLFVFAGLIFAVKLGDPARWIESFLVFAAFCAASSAGYLLNDVSDAEQDRAHPLKRSRPIAAGELSASTALGVATALSVVAIILALPTGAPAVGFVLLFMLLQAAYSLGLKKVALLDAVVIAVLFVIRAAVGAVAIDVHLSPWLVLCTGLLALFLAFGKRRGELLLVHGEQTAGRPVLASYSVELLDQLIGIVCAATISAYSIYTFTATDSDAMMLTIPFVVLGLFRYLYLMHERGHGEEPDRVALADVPLLVTIAAWIVTAALILALV